MNRRKTLTQWLLIPTALTFLAGALSALTATGGSATEQETPQGIIAAHIRDQGFKCDKPEGAKQDSNASKPNETVWLLTCENASYRVTLVPDLAAKVERLN